MLPSAKTAGCGHVRQIHKQTFVELNPGKWTPSTLEWLCLDCLATGLKTPKEAFMGESVKRKTEITRDDR